MPTNVPPFSNDYGQSTGKDGIARQRAAKADAADATPGKQNYAHDSQWSSLAKNVMAACWEPESREDHRRSLQPIFVQIEQEEAEE